jgi:hypothetical protein
MAGCPIPHSSECGGPKIFDLPRRAPVLLWPILLYHLSHDSRRGWEDREHVLVCEVQSASKLYRDLVQYLSVEYNFYDTIFACSVRLAQNPDIWSSWKICDRIRLYIDHLEAKRCRTSCDRRWICARAIWPSTRQRANFDSDFRDFGEGTHTLWVSTGFLQFCTFLVLFRLIYHSGICSALLPQV